MKKQFLLFLLVLWGMFSYAQTNIYVNASASGSNSGTSWGNAYTNLAMAINAANSGSSAYHIYVAAGTYQPTNQYGSADARDATFAILRSDVKLYGGYNAADGTRNLTANPTILSGNNSKYHVMVIAGVDVSTDSIIVDGFTLTGGKGEGEALDSYTFNGKMVYRINGGGIHTIENTGNKIALRNCIISGNTAYVGGGMYNWKSSPILTNVTISGNTATHGGGIYNTDDGTMPILTNVIISGNTASANGGGIHNTGAASTRLINVTISGNTATNGGAIYHNYSSSDIRNTIIYGNNSGIVGAVNISYSLVQGRAADANKHILDGATDPLFVNPQAAGLSTTGDYRLQANSPALNKGNNADVPTGTTTDLAGNPRIQGGTVDLGAYETYVAPPTLYVNAAASTSGDGTTWATAYKTLGEALDVANGNAGVKTINVAAGMYSPTNQYGSAATRDATFAITRSNLKLYGGYIQQSGTWVRQSAFVGGLGASTILNGNNSNYNVMVIAGVNAATDSVVVDGFIVFAGKADGSGSRTINGKDIFQNNGGGIYTIENTGDKIALRNCIIADNTADAGAGMYNRYSSPILSHVAISGNTGGGIANIYASPILSNVSINGNTAPTNGGGMYNAYSSPILTNVTISGNMAVTHGGGMYNTSLSAPKIRNTIIYGNNSGMYNDGTSPDIAYSLVQGIAADASNNILDGTTDPLFVNPQAAGLSDAGDYRLQANSPALNAGSNSYYEAGQTPDLSAIATDLGGSPRIQNGTVDLGAYETLLAPVTLYVNVAASASGDGTAWATAYKTLDEALNFTSTKANPATIYVAAGTYKPTNTHGGTARDAFFGITRGDIKIYGGYNATDGTRNLTANPTILSGDIGTADDKTDNSYHVMVIAGLTNSADSVVIDGLTITKGMSNGYDLFNFNGKDIGQANAAGVYVVENGAFDKLLFRNTIFTDNDASYGGGIAFENALGTFDKCTFTNNNASQSGAGIATLTDDNIKVLQSEFKNNTAYSGAAIFIQGTGGNTNIANSVFENNQSFSGGAIQSSGGVLVINGSTFTGNGAQQMGGAIFAMQLADGSQINGSKFLQNTAQFGGALGFSFTTATKVANCIFDGNTATTGNGGAVISQFDNGLTFGNCVFSGNSAQQGGAVKLSNATGVSFAQCTFNNNSATAEGQAIYIPDGSTVAFNNSIIWKDGSYTGDDNINTSTTLTLGNNIIQQTNVGGAPLPATNSNADPKFANAANVKGTDGIYGTADDGLQLLEGSPASNSGNNTLVPVGLTTDITGVPRIQQTTVDMGAYEFDTTPKPMNITFAKTDVTTCSTANTGAATATVTGGTGPYTYSWKLKDSEEELATTASLTNVVGGKYMLTVTDALGTIKLDSVEIASPPAFEVVATQTNVTDNTVTDGTASVAVSGAKAPYTYLWKQGTTELGTGTSINNLAAGKYTCLITDDSGCTYTQEFVITSQIIREVYVNQAVATNGDGASWAAAFKTLKEGLTFSNDNTTVDMIKVAAGTYYPTGTQSGTDVGETFAITRGGIKLYGGYDAATGQRNIATNPTLLSGDIGSLDNPADNSLHVMRILTPKGADSVIVDGFSIEDGVARENDRLFNLAPYSGGAIYIQGYNIGIANCTFKNNGTYKQSLGGSVYAHTTNSLKLKNCSFVGSSGRRGGIVNVFYSTVTIEGCTFKNGQASDSGGAIFLNSSQATVTKSNFQNNHSEYRGGAIYQESSDASHSLAINIDGTTFVDNTCAGGGGALASNRYAVLNLKNSLFVGNKAPSCDAVLSYRASNTISNCTFYGNGQISSSNATIGNTGPYIDIAVNNCIFWGNKAANNVVDIFDASVVNVKYSIVQQTSGVYAGTGNVNEDPLFVNTNNLAGADGVFGTADDGLALQNCSPATNKGWNEGIDIGTAKDIVGNARVQDGRADMGAYERTVAAATAQMITSGTTENSNNQSSTGATTYVDKCGNLLATVTGDGTPNSVSGIVEVKTAILNGQTPYVNRAVEINPQNNPSTSSGTVTVSYTQADFDNYNANNPNNVPLPSGPSNVIVPSLLVIDAYEGSSSDGSLNPNTYSSPIPDPLEVTTAVWNEEKQVWKVGFDAPHFSGFFLRTKPKALPLSLLSFEGKTLNNGNQLVWKTAIESNLTNYILQRSNDGKTFSEIGTLKPKNGQQQTYSYLDKTWLSGTLYYRLKITENNGKVTYSNVVALQGLLVAHNYLSPNPATNVVQINLADKSLLNTEAVMVNVGGQTVKKLRITTTQQQVDISGLPSGVYMISLANGERLKLIKQ